MASRSRALLEATAFHEAGTLFAVTQQVTRHAGQQPYPRRGGLSFSANEGNVIRGCSNPDLD